MTSPARLHQQRVLAERAAREAAPGDPVAGTVSELMLAQLYDHRLVLKGIQSVERKIEAKRTFLPTYDAYVDGALAGGQGGEDQVLVTIMVWHLDVGSWPRALDIADYVIQHGLALPDQYSRDAATLLIDETSTAALAGKLAGADAIVALERVAELTDGQDVPDQARAKLHKAIGYTLIGKTPSNEPDLTALDAATAQAAFQQLQRARELFSAVGVIKDMERLERRLKAEPPGPD